MPQTSDTDATSLPIPSLAAFARITMPAEVTEALGPPELTSLEDETHNPRYEDVKSHLENLGLGIKDLDGLATISSMEEIQALHRLIGNVRSRRDQIIREIDRRRSTKASQPRSDKQAKEMAEIA